MTADRIFKPLFRNVPLFIDFLIIGSFSHYLVHLTWEYCKEENVLDEFIIKLEVWKSHTVSLWLQKHQISFNWANLINQRVIDQTKPFPHQYHAMTSLSFLKYAWFFKNNFYVMVLICLTNKISLSNALGSWFTVILRILLYYLYSSSKTQTNWQPFVSTNRILLLFWGDLKLRCKRCRWLC